MLKRSLERYAGCCPETIAQGSKAQVVFFIEDAKADIASMAAALRECAEYFEREAVVPSYSFAPQVEKKMMELCNSVLNGGASHG